MDDGVNLERLERLVSLLLVSTMKEETQQHQVVTLKRAGLSNLEVAELLGTTGAVVSQQLYSAKSTSSKKKK